MNLSQMEKGERRWNNKTTEERNQNQFAIGIDLGTSYSCVGVWQHGRVEIITNNLGNRTTPSWVAFTKTHRLIGEAAQNQAAMNSSNTIFDAKRLIGRKFDNPIVQEDMKHWPFKVIADTNNNPVIVVTYKDEEKKFTPEEISSMILVKMKDIAETYLGKQVKDAVVTVPAYFNDSQRKATKDAGLIAGLNVLCIINEPTAAAIAYGLGNELTGYDNPVTKNILVFDLGGGTFDVSLVAVQNDTFEVKAVSGDTHLGGGDFDTRLLSYLVVEFERKHKKKLGDNPRALARLRAACERAKRSLSSITDTSIDIDCLVDGKDFCITVTRERFEILNQDLFIKCLEPVKKCLKDAKVGITDVDDIILVGGSSRIPKVQQCLQDYFYGKDLCRSINPDEAVACGAATLAAILAGDGHLKDIVVLDVTPLSLGIQNYDESFTVVIPRNTTIPVKIFRGFETAIALDNVYEGHFYVYEGESFIAEDNNFLGTCKLYNIPPGPMGAAKFDIFMEIDANGILTVSATLKGTCNVEQITITEHSGRLSKDEIDRMVKEGEMYKADDEEFKRAIKAKTALENYIEEVRLTVGRYRGRSKIDVIASAEDTIARTFEWLDWNYLCGNPSVFEQKLDELQIVFDGILGNKGKTWVSKLNEVD